MRVIIICVADMTFISMPPLALQPLGRTMGEQDIIWLAALGSARKAPTDTDTICRLLDGVSGGAWSPSAQLICDCLTEMTQSGFLTTKETRSGMEFAAAPRGKKLLVRLMGIPLDQTSHPLGRVGGNLKLALLDLADTDTRRMVLADLIRMHRQDAARVIQLDAPTPVLGPDGQEWRQRELAAIEEKIQWLQDVINDGS
jgi:DNA-binding PadR family transcriptional regulator